MIKADSDKIDLVIFTLYFPPMISTASNRLEAFAKYLDKEKFNITVICPETGEDEENLSFDKVRVVRIGDKPHPLKIKFNGTESFLLHKAKALYSKSFSYFVHDENRNWENEAVEVFEKLNNEQKIDVVISTFPTVGPHNAVLGLISKGYNFKWIADMRDGMSQNPFINSFHRNYLAKIEKNIYEKADLITTTTPGLVNEFKKLAGDIVPVEEIRNGFDFELTDEYTYNEIFTITHTGTFYSEIKPFSFLQAISSLLSEGKLPEIRVIFVGAGNTVTIPEKLKRIVITTPKIPHKEAEQRIKNSDSNLLIVPQSISKYLPGKLYEYIASRKPVIALAKPDSEAARMVTQCKLGFIADIDSEDEIKQAILSAYDLWKEHKKLNVDIEYFKQFHRKEQVKKLEKIILEKL